MKKKTVRIIAMLMLVTLTVGVLSLTVSAATDEVSGTWGSLTWRLNRSTGRLTISGSGAMDALNISTPKAWQVYQSSIKSVNITEGVTTIGNGAFEKCTALTEVQIASSVYSIGACAFMGCHSLTSITIPQHVSSFGTNVFSDCQSLSRITVHRDNPFYHSSGNCLINTETKTLIAGCKNSLIPADGSVTTIGRFAFHSQKKMTSIVIPNGVTTIGYGAFFECVALSEVFIPYSVTTIDEFAFYMCTDGLKEIVIPGGVRTIGRSAFNDCRNLKRVVIRAGVTSIGANAFYKCGALEEIIYCGTEKRWNAVEKDANWDSTAKYKLSFHEFDDDKDTVCNVCKYERTLESENVTTETPPTTSAPAITEAGKRRHSLDFGRLFHLHGCHSSMSAGAGLSLLLALGGAGVMMRKRED